MKITRRQLRKLLAETFAPIDRQYFGVGVDQIVEAWKENMHNLYEQAPHLFMGRSTQSEWIDQVDKAAKEFQERLENAILDSSLQVEDLLHDGHFHKRDTSKEGPGA
jgi:hypothetical protein